MNRNIDLKALLPHVLALIIMLLANVAYFSPQLEGKVVQQGDIVNATAMAKEVMKVEEETGTRPLWTNSMFGGMPAYQIAMKSGHNLLLQVARALRIWFPNPIGIFFAGMLCFYLFFQLMGVGPWVSTAAAMAFGFNSNSLILWEAGHTSKVHAIIYFSLIFAGIVLLFRKKWWTGGLLFALGLGLNILANHVQMTYYFFLVLIPYFLVELVQAVRGQELKDFGKAIGIMAVAGLLAVGSSATKLWTTYEYSRDTMRGKPILEIEKDKEITSSSETEGLEWNYAMNWSGNVMDCLATFIPGAAGGSSAEKFSSGSAISKELRRMGARLDRGPLYWGGQPGTSGPSYIGAIVWFLFILSMFVVKAKWKWGLLASVILAFLLSMGRYLPGFNHLIFDLIPLYNKFRSPFSIHGVTSFLVPALGFYGLWRIIKTKNTDADLKDLYKAVGIGGGIALLMALLGPSLFDFTSPQDQRIISQGLSADALIQDRKALLRSDSIRVLLLILASGGILWAYIKNKLAALPTIALIGILAFGDVWSVGKRYFDGDDFVSKNRYQTNFSPRPVDDRILKDPEANYRVLDLTVSTFNSAIPSYHHKTVGGYHAAKLQRYQDLMDRHIQPEIQKLPGLLQGIQNNPTDSLLRSRFDQLPVLNMLNTKYFILGQRGQEIDLPNPSRFGPAWFVRSIKKVDSPNEEIDALSSTPLRNTAVVNAEYDSYSIGTNLTGSGSISLTSYSPDEITYQTSTSADEFAVFSEIWYGPNKGWNAYLDGQNVDHIRVNYALRGLSIPSGQHEVVFKFEPSSYYTGRIISLASSGLILLLLVGIAYKSFMAGELIPEKVAQNKSSGKKIGKKRKKKS